MTVLETIFSADTREVEIIAGDISQSCLKMAAAGFYQPDRLKNLPHGYLDRYFEIRDGGAFVSRNVQQLVRFIRLNLNDLMTRDVTGAKELLGSFDIIFCRNVMIYFSPPCQQILVETLHELLYSGGYLFTGDAEPLHLFRHEFIPVAADCLIYQKTEST
jgi:chemotaxis protein methyltransferase CheR